MLPVSAIESQARGRSPCAFRKDLRLSGARSRRALALILLAALFVAPAAIAGDARGAGGAGDSGGARGSSGVPGDAGSVPEPATGADSASAPAECFGAGCARAVLPSPAPGDTLRLPHRLVSAASLTLCAEERCFTQGVDYEVLPVAGAIVWLAPALPDEAPLVAEYRYLPLALAGKWGRSASTRAETLATVAAPERPSRLLPPGALLEVGGSKTFSVEFGSSRDAKLEQSLDLSLRGRLAEKVQVRAVLTDRATPLQPEGTSAELADLDQVLIEVDAPIASLRLGDVRTEQQGFAFTSHQREMEGMTVRAGRQEGPRAGGAFGRGLGRHMHLEFFGQEDKQGPYRLLAEDPALASTGRLPGEDAVIVAGSERVWLGGERLDRGEQSDYTIDYDSGELWFMPRRSISSVSEIRVDFQVREGAFDRDYASFSATSGDSGLGAAISWMRERDDPERSAALGLSPEEKEALALAGDDADAIGGGVTPDSLGDYALVEADTLAAEFYLYIAEDLDPGRYLSRYRVSFTDVGEGEGDYQQRTSPLGNIYYAYQGRKEGRFVPGRRISSPELRDVVSFKAGGPLAAGLSLSAEGALSQHDRNTLSGSGDSDNQGGALAIQSSWKLGRLWGGREDRVELRFAGRHVAERFSPPEPLVVGFEARRWNASADSVLVGEDRRSALGLTVRPGARLTLGAEWENLSTGNRFAGDRLHASARRDGRVNAQADVWESRTEEDGVPGQARRWKSALGWSGAWAIGTNFEMERLLRGAGGAESGEEFELYGLRAETPEVLKGLKAAVTTELRRDSDWRDGRRANAGDRRLYQTEVDYRAGSTLAHALYARRVHTGRPGEADTGSDLADWSLSHRATGSMSGEWRGRITTSENRLRIEQLQYVGGQGGHYDSLGYYTGEGDYELHYEPGDSVALETRIESVVRLSGRPFGKTGSGEGVLSGFETTLFGRVELSSGERLGALLESPAEILAGGDESRKHDRLTRGELTWKGRSGLPVPTLRLEARRGRERTPLGSLRRREGDEAVCELLWTVRSGIRGRLEYGLEREEEGVFWESGARSFDRRNAGKLAAEASWNLLRPLTVKVGGEGEDERFLPADEERRLYRAAWSVVAEPFSASRLEVGLERRWADNDIAGYSPFLLERPGWRLTCSGSFRPRPGLTGTLWIRVDHDDDRDAVVTGRMEARAYF